LRPLVFCRKTASPLSPSGLTFFYYRCNIPIHEGFPHQTCKGVDELGNIIEVKMWEIAPPTADKPYGCKYSLVYIVNGCG